MVVSGKHIKVIYINARSILKKLDIIKLTIQKLKPLIVCVCESWLNEAIPTAAVEVADFNCYRKDANGKEPLGGVLIYTHRSLRATQIKIP